MKSLLLIPALLLMAAPFSKSFADDGANMFRTNCGACHSIGKGKLVGPDLKGVDTRHSEAWILKWVKSSQSLVQAGDKDAVKLFSDNSSIVMPDQPLKDDEIKTVLAFIKAGGEQPVTADANTTSDNKGPDKITVATQKAATESKESSLLTMFSFTEYMLMFLMGILLIVIYILGMSVKTLTERVEEVKTHSSHS